MKQCPSCKSTFPVEDNFCKFDSTPLQSLKQQPPLRRWIKPLLCTVGALYLVAFSSWLTPFSESSKANQHTPEIEARILRGRQLFASMKDEIPAKVNPQVIGQLTDNAILSLYITNQLWNGLSKEQQIDLTWFIESEIRQAKKQPEQYLSTPKHAAFYPRFIESARQLCADCWVIELGDPVISDGRQTMTLERSVLKGESVWRKTDYFGKCCQGMSVSDFRQAEK